MKVKQLLILSLLVATAYSACKKEENKTASKMDLLTDGRWQMTAYTLSPPFDLNYDGTPDTDGLAAMEPCDRDNLFLFKKDGTLEIDEGPTKCNPFDPQINQTTTWAFVNNETEIIIDGDRATIQELTKTRFRVTVPVASSTGDITFTKR